MNQIAAVIAALLVALAPMEADIRTMILLGFIIIAEIGWLRAINRIDRE